MADAPYMYWVGMDTAPDTSPADMADFNDFYSNVHVHEVVTANPGFIRGTRYELCDPDPRGDFGPRWLAMYEMDGPEAAKGYESRNDGPPEGRPKYTPVPPSWSHINTRWRLMWHRLAPDGGELAAAGAPYLYFVAMNAGETDAAGLAAFNEFYTNTHVPEVVRVSDFRSGTRYELQREFLHPAPGAPRYLAVYEADEGSLKTRADRASNPGGYAPLSSGPPAWETHDTLWRLMYRRIDSWAK